MTLICLSKLTIIGSDDGLLPGRCQAIIWTNANTLLIGPLGANFSEIFSKVYVFFEENVFENFVWKMVPILSGPHRA